MSFGVVSTLDLLWLKTQGIHSWKFLTSGRIQGMGWKDKHMCSPCLVILLLLSSNLKREMKSRYVAVSPDAVSQSIQSSLHSMTRNCWSRLKLLKVQKLALNNWSASDIQSSLSFLKPAATYLICWSIQKFIIKDRKERLMARWIVEMDFWWVGRSRFDVFLCF